ncbi:hypothetical protein [Avrilella dinanensis]|uniref:hypothetical protein n=1 Tax=Avrilella dinanensis TaxID=2008672 RepID=UPI00240A0F0C|nr:hypothetical protein [Avrilella dinanensis]
MKNLLFLFYLLFFIGFSGFAPAESTNQQAVVLAKEQVVYITKTGKKYHKGSCRYLKKSKIKTSKSKVQKQGYTACKVCKP